FFFFQAEDGIRDRNVTGVQTCALPIFLAVIYEVTINAIPKRIPGIIPARNMEPIDTVPTTPYITKGILGGINTPIEPAEAVIAAANPLSYFFSFIEGIIKEPIAATVAGPEPEIAAKNILANTVTIAKPPAIKPINTVAKFKSLFEIPPWLIKTPAKIKKGIAIK